MPFHRPTKWVQYKYRLLSLIVICFTLLFFTWMIRDSLCELHIKQESYELAAFLACKLKE
ncbi:small toxic polypeptide [Escherichia coli]|nr:small toxic polypeptide [Escherichia coli]